MFSFLPRFYESQEWKYLLVVAKGRLKIFLADQKEIFYNKKADQKVL